MQPFQSLGVNLAGSSLCLKLGKSQRAVTKVIDVAIHRTDFGFSFELFFRYRSFATCLPRKVIDCESCCIACDIVMDQLLRVLLCKHVARNADMLESIVCSSNVRSNSKSHMVSKNVFGTFHGKQQRPKQGFATSKPQMATFHMEILNMCSGN